MAGQTAGKSCARAALQPLPDFLQFHYPLAGSIFSQGERKKRKNTPLPVAQRRRRPCAVLRWAPPFSRHWYPNPPLFFLPARLIFVSFVLQVAGLFFSLFFFLSFFEIRMRAFSCNGGAQVFILILIRCRKDYIVYKLRNKLLFSQAFRFWIFRTLLMR